MSNNRDVDEADGSLPTMSLLQLRRLHGRLLELAEKTSNAAQIGFDSDVFDIHEYGQLSEQEGPMAVIMISVIEELVRNIENQLPQYFSEEVLGAPLRTSPINSKGKWCLGYVDLSESFHPILRGFLEERRTIVVAPNLSPQIVIFFKSISGCRDLLHREQHGHVGYHYHYCNSKKQRSDTVLTFATGHQGSRTTLLMWERHGKGKSKFNARPERWRTPKRQSIFNACFPDLEKTPLSAYREPSAAALPVWPL